MSISLVIPAYNESVIGSDIICTASVSQANLAEGYEVLIVYDGSTDGMARLVRECGDPRARLEGYTPTETRGGSSGPVC